MHYVVRYEARINGQWYQILPCDGSHRHGHCHKIDDRGQKISREWATPGTTLGEAMSAAIKDIKPNWQRYRDEFIQRSPMLKSNEDES